MVRKGARGKFAAMNLQWKPVRFLWLVSLVNHSHVADDLSFQEVLNSFVKSMTANVGCLPNPCPNDEIPWPGYPDKCFQKTEKVWIEFVKSWSLTHLKAILSSSPSLPLPFPYLSTTCLIFIIDDLHGMAIYLLFRFSYIRIIAI